MISGDFLGKWYMSQDPSNPPFWFANHLTHAAFLERGIDAHTFANHPSNPEYRTLIQDLFRKTNQIHLQIIGSPCHQMQVTDTTESNFRYHLGLYLRFLLSYHNNACTLVETLAFVARFAVDRYLRGLVIAPAMVIYIITGFMKKLATEFAEEQSPICNL